MQKIYFFTILLALSQLGFSQVLSIKDEESNQPLEFVTITSLNPRAFTTTNVRGLAEIPQFSGAREIEIRCIGYKTVITSFEDLKTKDFNLFLKPSSISLDHIVVSATRWNQTAQEIPSRIINVTPKDVTLLAPQTTADLLGNTGEVFIQKSQQGGGSPMIRGFSSNRLLYTVDGVRMNTAIFRSGNLQNVISLDPFAMESAEVLFGPGSIIYGSDAIGGVMSFQTLTPQFSLKSENKRLISGKANSRFASANKEQTYHFDLNVGWNKWAILSSFSHNSFGDLRMGSHGPDEYLRHFYVQRHDSMDVVIRNDDTKIQRPSGYDQINLMQKIRYSPRKNLDLTYGFHYSATTDYSRYDRHIILNDGIPKSAEWKYGPQLWLMNNMNITYQPFNVFFDEATFRIAVQNFEESRINRDFNEPIRYTRIENVEAISANSDFIKKLGNNMTIMYGAEAVTNKVTSSAFDENINTGIKTPGPSRYPDATWSSYAAYLTYQYDLTPLFRVLSGIRYNQFIINADFTDNLSYYPLPESQTSLNNGALTGSIGLVYHSSESWSISTNLSSGFRAPNIDDIGKVFDSQYPSVIVPNTNLNAEYAYNAEIGIAKVFGEFLKIDLTAYYTNLQNAMVKRDFTLNGQDSIIYDGELRKVIAVQNAAVANVYGLQAGLEIQIPGGFGISSHYNYQHGEEEMKNGTTSPSRHAAPWFGVTRLTFKSGNLDMQIYAHYNGKRPYEDMPVGEAGKPYLYATDNNGNPYAPDWYTFNFKSMYQLNEIFALSAGVENITDQRYRPYSSGLTAPGRNFTIGIQAKF